MKIKLPIFQDDPTFNKFVAKMANSADPPPTIETTDLVSLIPTDDLLTKELPINQPSTPQSIAKSESIADSMGLTVDEGLVKSEGTVPALIPIPKIVITEQPSEIIISCQDAQSTIELKAPTRQKEKITHRELASELQTYLMSLPKANTMRGFAKDEIQIRLPLELSQILRYIPQYLALENSIFRLDDLAAHLLNGFITQHLPALKFMGQEVTKTEVAKYQAKLKEAADLEKTFNRFT